MTDGWWITEKVARFTRWKETNLEGEFKRHKSLPYTVYAKTNADSSFRLKAAFVDEEDAVHWGIESFASDCPWHIRELGGRKVFDSAEHLQKVGRTL